MRKEDKGLDESKLERLTREIQAAQAELSARQAELAEMNQDLAAFRAQYNVRLGSRIAELERVERELEAYKRKIDFHRHWGAQGVPQTRAGANYVSVEEQYRRTWREPQEPASERSSWSKLFKRVNPVDAPLEARIRTIYRELCRRYHPDLVQDEKEKARRTEITASINAAYAKRIIDARQSLSELEALAEAATYAQWEVSGTTVQRAAALRNKLQRLRKQLVDVEKAMRALTDSPELQISLEIKLGQRQGRDLLAEMQAQVEQRLARKHAELEFTKAQLRELGLASS